MRRSKMSVTGTLYEVFVRSKHGLNHKHVGSVHAADAAWPSRNARELYTRRSEGG